MCLRQVSHFADAYFPLTPPGLVSPIYGIFLHLFWPRIRFRKFVGLKHSETYFITRLLPGFIHSRRYPRFDLGGQAGRKPRNGFYGEFRVLRLGLFSVFSVPK